MTHVANVGLMTPDVTVLCFDVQIFHAQLGKCAAPSFHALVFALLYLPS